MVSHSSALRGLAVSVGLLALAGPASAQVIVPRTKTTVTKTTTTATTGPVIRPGPVPVVGPAVVSPQINVTSVTVAKPGPVVVAPVPVVVPVPVPVPVPPPAPVPAFVGVQGPDGAVRYIPVEGGADALLSVIALPPNGSGPARVIGIPPR